mgnify:CR=1 FL=1
MKSAVMELIDVLHGSDSEGSGLAYALREKSMGAGMINTDAPPWHPSNPTHPLHDDWQDHGHDMWKLGDARVVHPLHDREQAERKAEAVRANLSPHVRERVERDDTSAVHPGHPLHDFYLANPAWYHHHALHMPGQRYMGSDFGVTRGLMAYSNRPEHPLNPNHPDHMSFLAAHARNDADGRSWPTAGPPGVSLSIPYGPG